jgi:hypothetical protein
MAKQSGGVGFGGLLTVLFVGLKLTDVIDWSWWWVLAPLWIPAALVAVIVFSLCVASVVVKAAKAAK